MLFISSTFLKLAYLVERKAVSGSLLELPSLLHWMLIFSIKYVNIVCLIPKKIFIIFNILSQQRVCPLHCIALQLVALASLENFLLPILGFLCSCHLSAAPLDHSDGQFFSAMEWLMFFFRPPSSPMVFQWF